MNKLRQEVFERIQEIRSKANSNEEPNEEDMKVLFLASLMEEERHGSKD
jgi:hypothetical protein